MARDEAPHQPFAAAGGGGNGPVPSSSGGGGVGAGDSSGGGSQRGGGSGSSRSSRRGGGQSYAVLSTNDAGDDDEFDADFDDVALGIKQSGNGDSCLHSRVASSDPDAAADVNSGGGADPETSPSEASGGVQHPPPPPFYNGAGNSLPPLVMHPPPPPGHSDGGAVYHAGGGVGGEYAGGGNVVVGQPQTFHAQPPPLQVPPEFRVVMPPSEDAWATWQMAKSVRFFAGLDCFLIVLYSMSFFLLIILLPAPLSGYKGASELIPKHVAPYLAFTALATLFRLYALTAILSANGNQTTFFMWCIGLAIQVYILKLVNKFYSSLLGLEASGELAELRAQAVELEYQHTQATRSG